MRRWLVIPILALALLPSAAAARTVQKGVGSGRLEATGAGAITVQGSLVAFGRIDGAGALRVLDMAGDAQVTVNGVSELFVSRRGFSVVNLPNASGGFYVQGSRVRVRLFGPTVTASVAGRGRAVLEGSGVYRLNNSPKRAWPARPGSVQLVPFRRR